MDTPLFKLLAAIRLESEGVPERLTFLVGEARRFGLDQVPQYADLVASMDAAATLSLSDLNERTRKCTCDHPLCEHDH